MKLPLKHSFMKNAFKVTTLGAILFTTVACSTTPRGYSPTQSYSPSKFNFPTIDQTIKRCNNLAQEFGDTKFLLESNLRTYMTIYNRNGGAVRGGSTVGLYTETLKDTRHSVKRLKSINRNLYALKLHAVESGEELHACNIHQIPQYKVGKTLVP